MLRAVGACATIVPFFREGIVDAFGGDIDVTGTPGGGTTLTVDLPLSM